MGPAPKPIPGGFDIPPLIHEFIPGPETITLPFTLITLQGLHFLGPHDTPAVLNMTIEWDALEDPVELGSGATVPPTDPAAFLGSFAKARSTAHFSGRQLSFSFRSDPGASSDDGYAEIGTERNGLFL